MKSISNIKGHLKIGQQIFSKKLSTWFMPKDLDKNIYFIYSFNRIWQVIQSRHSLAFLTYQIFWGARLEFEWFERIHHSWESFRARQFWDKNGAPLYQKRNPDTVSEDEYQQITEKALWKWGLFGKTKRTFEMLTDPWSEKWLKTGSRSFQRGTVGLCRSNLKFEGKKSAPQPELHHMHAAQIRVSNNLTIYIVWQTVTLQPFELQRLAIPLLKDLNLITKHSINLND